jgi:uncharacterized protein YPO0396
MGKKFLTNMNLNGEDWDDNPLSGFRLQHFELRNWGTFNKWIWTLTPRGRNALLTGDIGSGKSTIVDAITTLLVRQDRIIYNKAAGAESRERTTLSYIRGAYKNEKTGSSYLRDENTYSIIMGQFFNEHFDQHVTLAQVFWIRNSKPDKFFIIAHQPLEIKSDFSNFGTDIYRLKKRLKNSHNIEVFDTFLEYSNRFRQLFGIKQAEALDLFYQTVSMKSVGNLTEFVREQMLGKTNIQEKIRDLVGSYEELTKAHDAAQRARNQKEMLEPLMVQIAELASVKKDIDQYHASLQEIPRWFSAQRVAALQKKLTDEADEYLRNGHELAALEAELVAERTLLRQLEGQRDRMEISRQLNEIETGLAHLEQDRARQMQAATRYESLCRDLDFPVLIDEDTFYNNKKKVREELDAAQVSLAQLSADARRVHVDLEKVNGEIVELQEEVESLSSRQTQIPERSIALRRQILNTLGLDENEIPYGGELIRIRDEERAWEGAIERRLHDFGLSMLVPDRHYKQISRYVNDNHLNGRLVNLRIFDRQRNDHIDMNPASLYHKVEIKTDSEFCDWLEAELCERYNYVCCETLDEFHREPYALTKEGQIKSGKVRHEKNDLRSVRDRKHYVLGWTNAEKIREYRKELEGKERLAHQYTLRLEELTSQEEKLSNRKDFLRDLSQFNDFNEVNFKRTVTEIQEQQERKNELEAGSVELKDIQERLETINRTIQTKENLRGDKHEWKGKLKDRITHSVLLLKRNLGSVGVDAGKYIDTDSDIFTLLKDQVEAWTAIELPSIAFSDVTLGLVVSVKDRFTVDQLDTSERQLMDRINNPGGLLDKKKTRQSKLETEIVLAMDRFRKQYQADTIDVDATLESIPDFQKIYDKLVTDDIPRHEERFRKLLKEGTINGILVFQNHLAAYEAEVGRKISEINRHLVDISYNTGTYIFITQEPVPDLDIGDFRKGLRACLENIYGETDSYNEEKFQQVKKILDRFKGETDEDRRWTERVTDVRQWYIFGASERYQEDHKEKEYYSDSSGKSGGQKEKLAYTILASAIAFQFGLSWDEARSRSFRFVVIDEAFGRGSDESTRYGLRLFRKLNLQLLIVTPLQKVNIIEDYINAVHFVSNPTGEASMVRNITKDDYVREKREHFAKLQQAG